MSNILFQSLSHIEKCDFFVKCQEILIKFHPDSHFIFREDNIKTRRLFVNDFINKYKGFCHQEGNLCILFNRVKIDDAKDSISALKSNLYQPPSMDYNGVSVDFAAFDKLENCLAFCKSQYEKRIQYIIFVKNNEPKIYDTNKLLERINATLKT